MKKVLFTSHVASFIKFNRPFMQWFKAQGYEVHYASMGEEKVSDCDTHFTVPFARSPFSFSNVRAYRQLKKIIDAEKYDLIHTHTPMGSVVTRFAAIGARKRGTRVIYTAHGFHFYSGAPLMNWLAYYPMEKLMARFTDSLVTVNEEDYGRAKKQFNTKNIYKIDGVGVDLTRFKPSNTSEKQALRAQYQYDKNDFILICVAEFTKNKNQAFLINAFASLVAKYPNMKLIFAGVGSELDACKSLCDSLDLPKNAVNFLGYRKDVDQLYLLSDVLVAASYREGLPVNIIEAMASGLPVVCTNIRGCCDLIKEKKNGYLYDINDLSSFISAIELLYANKSVYRMISRHNVKDSKVYSLENSIENMENIYEETP